MKKTKLFAVVMAAVMTLSLVACGEKQTGNDVTPTTAPTTAPTEAPADPTPTEVPAPQNVTIADASITFEDGNMGFVDAYMSHARSANVELSIVDFNGSKALKVVNTTGTSKAPFVAIDVSSFLGADVAKVAGVEMVIGTSSPDGKFHAVSGEIGSWWGAEQEKNVLGSWSVYMAKKNPKVITGAVPAGNELVADAFNIVYVGMTTDNAATDEGVCSEFYIDDIRFYDAAGNTLKGDTTVAFNWPALDGPDMTNLYALSNTVEFAGFNTKEGAWTQAGFDVPQEIWDALVPGTAIEISYTSEDGSMWIVMPDSAAGWMRVAQGQAYINDSKTTAQITYEQMVEVLGEDKTTWGARMQCEAATAWEVYSVKVGTANKRMAVANAVEFEGFVTKEGAWTQAGFEMTQEFLDALVPGSVIEIDYTSEDGALWIVMPWATAGWMRCGQGTAVCDGSKCYVTYEQIEEMCGTDKTTWGAMLQCEGSSAWEVYGLRVGKKVEYPVISGLTEIDGYACKEGAWTQAGAEMPQALIDALVPGSIIEISYTSEDGEIWIVMPWATAGWMRCAQNQATYANGKAYITYEQIAAACGEDKTTWGAMMQFEGSSAWEVYGIRVGKYVAEAAEEDVEEEPAPALPAPVVTVGEGKGTVVGADANWWTQAPLTKEELFAGVAEENVTGFKFSCDVTFIVGFNGPKETEEQNTWVSLENATSYVVKAEEIELGDFYYLAVVFNKADSVEYTINWEVLTGEITAEEPAVEAPVDDVLAEYAGDYGLGWSASVADLQAFTGNVTITFDVAYTGTVDYAQFTFIDQGDSWSKLKAADFTGNVPTINSYEFIEMFDPSVTSFSTTITADALARIIANGGGLGIQVNGIVVRNAVLTAAE